MLAHSSLSHPRCDLVRGRRSLSTCRQSVSAHRLVTAVILTSRSVVAETLTPLTDVRGSVDSIRFCRRLLVLLMERDMQEERHTYRERKVETMDASRRDFLKASA